MLLVWTFCTALVCHCRCLELSNTYCALPSWAFFSSCAEFSFHANSSCWSEGSFIGQRNFICTWSICSTSNYVERGRLLSNIRPAPILFLDISPPPVLLVHRAHKSTGGEWRSTLCLSIWEPKTCLHSIRNLLKHGGLSFLIPSNKSGKSTPAMLKSFHSPQITIFEIVL